MASLRNLNVSKATIDRARKNRVHKILGSAVHDNVGAPLERILDGRRSESRVDAELAADLVRSPGVMLDGPTFSSRIERRLEPDQGLAAGILVVQADESLRPERRQRRWALWTSSTLLTT